MTNPVYKKFIKYFDEKFDHKRTQYNLFDIDFLKSIKEYDALEFTNIQQLEEKYLKTTILQDYEKILPENYVVLRRGR